MLHPWLDDENPPSSSSSDGEYKNTELNTLTSTETTWLHQPPMQPPGNYMTNGDTSIRKPPSKAASCVRKICNYKLCCSFSLSSLYNSFTGRTASNFILTIVLGFLLYLLIIPVSANKFFPKCDHIDSGAERNTCHKINAAGETTLNIVGGMFLGFFFLILEIIIIGAKLNSMHTRKSQEAAAFHAAKNADVASKLDLIAGTQNNNNEVFYDEIEALKTHLNIPEEINQESPRRIQKLPTDLQQQLTLTLMGQSARSGVTHTNQYIDGRQHNSLFEN